MIFKGTYHRPSGSRPTKKARIKWKKLLSEYNNCNEMLKNHVAQSGGDIAERE